jgi:hypothetical protein
MLGDIWYNDISHLSDKRHNISMSQSACRHPWWEPRVQKVQNICILVFPVTNLEINVRMSCLLVDVYGRRVKF